MRKLLIFLYVICIRCWMTFYGNVFYWLRHLSQLDEARCEKARLKDYAEYMYNIIKTLEEFKWKSDPLKGLVDWSPWPVTIINKRKEDDCDGAARLARWMCKYCKQVDFAHEYIIMDGWSVKSTHVICIGSYRDSHKWFCFSNGRFFEADSFNAIMNEFGYTDLLASSLRLRNP